MDNRAIGVFDSGLGGLTAVKQLICELPQEDIVYFGDTGRVPYGTHSPETILKYVRGDIRFLKTFDIKMIVVACGTASTVALPALNDSIGMPVVGVVEPACAAAVKASRSGRIGIVGTPATIASRAYGKMMRTLERSVEIHAVACPLFVPLVENGHTDTEVARLVAEEYLSPLRSAQIDTLILGCTHYPLLKGVISEIVGEDVTLIDVGEEAARFVGRYLTQNDMLNGQNVEGRRRYYVSDATDNFEKLGSLFLQQQIEGLVRKVDIEEY